MQNESANPVLKVLFKMKAELRGVRVCFVLVYAVLIRIINHCLDSDLIKI